MTMPVVIMLVVWPVSLLNMTHVINSIDPVNSLLLAVAATVFTIRYSIRQRNSNKRKTLSF